MQALTRGNKARTEVEKKVDLMEGKDLPRLKVRNLRKYFDRYNTASSAVGDGDAIDDEELLVWMLDCNALYPDDPPTIHDARNIINIYDKDGDNELQFEELEEWLENASELTLDERTAMSLSGAAFRQMVGFVVNILKKCDEGGPPPLTDEDEAKRKGIQKEQEREELQKVREKKRKEKLEKRGENAKTLEVHKEGKTKELFAAPPPIPARAKKQKKEDILASTSTKYASKRSKKVSPVEKKNKIVKVKVGGRKLAM